MSNNLQTGSKLAAFAGGLAMISSVMAILGACWSLNPLLVFAIIGMAISVILGQIANWHLV